MSNKQQIEKKPLFPSGVVSVLEICKKYGFVIRTGKDKYYIEYPNKDHVVFESFDYLFAWVLGYDAAKNENNEN